MELVDLFAGSGITYYYYFMFRGLVCLIVATVRWV
jgi:hypothetical protein